MKPLIIAHRGFSAIAPENTLAAFSKALELGVDYIELDIHLTKDDQVVIIHDETLERTTNGQGYVGDKSLEEIKKLDAGSWFDPAFKSEKIPTLEELIKLVNGKALLFIEVKKGKALYGGIEQRTIELIDRCGAREWCILHSFEKEVLYNIYHIDPSFPLYMTLEFDPSSEPFVPGSEIKEEPSYLSYESFKGYNVNHEVVDTTTMKKVRKMGWKIVVWTVNEETDIQRMVDLQVDGIITNFPDRVKRLV